MSGRLGELLVRENLISVQQLRKAQEEQQKTGTRIGTALIKTGAIEESKLTDFLSKQYGVPTINLADYEVEASVIKIIPAETARRSFGVLLVVAVTGAPGWDRVKLSFFSPEVAWRWLPEILDGLWLNVRLLLVCGVAVLAYITSTVTSVRGCPAAVRGDSVTLIGSAQTSLRPGRHSQVSGLL